MKNGPSAEPLAVSKKPLWRSVEVVPSGAILLSSLLPASAT
jgi:hypothetical protein